MSAVAKFCDNWPTVVKVVDELRGRRGDLIIAFVDNRR